jgi:hypothetical protein
MKWEKSRFALTGKQRPNSVTTDNGSDKDHETTAESRTEQS